MYFKDTVLCGLLAAATLVAADAASDVTQLKKDTFEDFIKSNDLVLAECKPSCLAISASERADKLLLSLRTMVRSLQGPRPRIRGGRNVAEGEEHQVGQGRLH
jgi:hypothetical protein